MQDSIFSKNELIFMKNRNELKKEHSKNYLYQIKHSIRKKLSNFVINDLHMLLHLSKNRKFQKFDRQKRKEKELLDIDLCKTLITEILKIHPNLILRVFKIPEIKNYLGVEPI